jgi:hypothetical protein
MELWCARRPSHLVGSLCGHVPWNRKGRRRTGDVLVKKQELIEWLVKNGDEAAPFDIEGSHFPAGG